MIIREPLLVMHFSIPPVCPTLSHSSPPVLATSHHQLELLQAILHSHLDGLKHFHNNIPTLPPVALHFKVSIPFTFNMDESFQFLLGGISVALLLGDHQVETLLTL